MDTDVFSYLSRAGDSRGAIYRQRVEAKLLCVSFVTVGEVLFGAYKKKWGTPKLEELNLRLRSVVIVPYEIEICRTYADLKVRLQARGKPVADNDLWIASSAVRHSIPLVSNNRAHFEGIPELILITEAPAISEIESQMELSASDATAGELEPPS